MKRDLEQRQEHMKSHSAQNGTGLKATEMQKQIFTLAECAAILGRSRQTTSRIFEKEPGVIVLERPETPRKRTYRSITVPRSVLTRVLGRLSKGGLVAVHYIKKKRTK